MHSGTVRITGPRCFRGMVTGTLVIAAGCTVEMAGMVNGTLVVEPGADVLVSGMVNGDIVDEGGRIAVTGMLDG